MGWLGILNTGTIGTTEYGKDPDPPATPIPTSVDFPDWWPALRGFRAVESSGFLDLP